MCCRATDRAVEPLKVELAELEQLIKDQQDKICAVKSNILKNEDKIQKMVTGINFSSRTWKVVQWKTNLKKSTEDLGREQKCPFQNNGKTIFLGRDVCWDQKLHFEGQGRKGHHPSDVGCYDLHLMDAWMYFKLLTGETIKRIFSRSAH